KTVIRTTSRTSCSLFLTCSSTTPSSTTRSSTTAANVGTMFAISINSSGCWVHTPTTKTEIVRLQLLCGATGTVIVYTDCVTWRTGCDASDLSTRNLCGVGRTTVTFVATSRVRSKDSASPRTAGW